MCHESSDERVACGCRVDDRNGNRGGGEIPLVRVCRASLRSECQDDCPRAFPPQYICRQFPASGV